MDATPSSITQGCFLFNAASFKSSSILEGSFQTLPGETCSDTATRRAKMYHKLWSTAKSIIEDISSGQYKQLFVDLIKFVEESAQQLSRLPARAGRNIDLRVNEDGSSEGMQLKLPPRLEIPTAVIVAGVNMPDHDDLYRQLRSKISLSVTPHIVQLQSDACGSGIKTAWKEILSQLTSETVSERETQETSSAHFPEHAKT